MTKQEQGEMRMMVGMLLIGLVVVVIFAGRAFDRGMDNRCQAWGNPQVCEK